MEIKDCLHAGAGICRNVDMIEDLIARAEATEADNARLREQVATLCYALNTVINAERGITQYHVDLALNALQETA